MGARTGMGARTDAEAKMNTHDPSHGSLAGVLLSILVLVGCGPGTLAEADRNRLSVDDAAALIADNSSVVIDSQVVRVVAELWVDYTLLASRLAEDSTLQALDVRLVTEAPLNELMISRLREEVVDVDTVVTDGELTERFAADMPGARATASQILLLFPRPATTLQRDSVAAAAADLSARLAGGADFAAMAANHSDDPAGASRGGSMGTFGRGEMLAPVDSAVFGLGPGETSDPVETAIGYHILRLDALEVPQLSDVGAEFRRQIQLERLALAENEYVMRLDSTLRLRLAEGALALARALAETAPTRLSHRAAQRPLVVWEGGSYDAGDFLMLARNSGEVFRAGIVSASGVELEAVLRRLGQEELLLQDVRSRGLVPTGAQADSVAAAARAAIRERAAVIGLMPAAAVFDSTAGQDPVRSMTVAGHVEAALVRVVSGESEIVPLGGVTLLLRDQAPWRINAAAIRATLQRIEELR